TNDIIFGSATETDIDVMSFKPPPSAAAAAAVGDKPATRWALEPAVGHDLESADVSPRTSTQGGSDDTGSRSLASPLIGEVETQQNYLSRLSGHAAAAAAPGVKAAASSAPGDDACCLPATNTSSHDDARLQFVQGDFFQPLPKELQGVDVVLMKFILHDWRYEEASHILTNVRNCLLGNLAESGSSSNNKDYGTCTTTEALAGASTTPILTSSSSSNKDYGTCTTTEALIAGASTTPILTSSSSNKAPGLVIAEQPANAGLSTAASSLLWMNNWFQQKESKYKAGSKERAGAVRLILVEHVLPEMPCSSSASTAFASDLEMLTGCGGLERTQAQWEQLLGSCGFRLEYVRPVTPVGHICLIAASIINNQLSASSDELADSHHVTTADQEVQEEGYHMSRPHLDADDIRFGHPGGDAADIQPVAGSEGNRVVVVAANAALTQPLL
ncbi:hypothetical protein CEUSTIGMA_g8516.t1, partial [Chlamydomonas eustigma]